MLTVPLRDGTEVTLRPAVPGDRQLLVDGFARLSAESRYLRFFSPLATLSPSAIDVLTDVGGADHFAWVALVGDEGVGVARYIRGGDPDAAEVAVTVIDDFQGRGLGSVLFAALAARAVDEGLRRFEGNVLAENEPMLRLLGRAGASFRPDGDGVLHFEVRLVPSASALQR